MTNVNKLLLFISYECPELSGLASSYLTSFKESDDYRYIIDNINTGESLNSHKIIEIKTKLDELNWNTGNMERAVILGAQVYYLGSLTFERYYLNPMIIGNTPVLTKSLGDLLFPFDGELIPFNQLIFKKGYSLQYKYQAIDNEVKEYNTELKKYLIKPIKAIKDTSMVKSHLTIKGVLNYLEILFLFAVNILFIALFFIPNFNYQYAILNPPTSKPGSIIIWTYFILLFLYDAILIVYLLSHNKEYEPLYYTRRYLKLRRGKIDKMVDQKSIKLANYFKEAVRTNTPLNDDVHTFARFGDDSIDIEEVQSLQNGPGSKRHQVITAIHNIFFGLMFLALIALIAFMIFYHFTKGDIL